jgi:hypothetical protein
MPDLPMTIAALIGCGFVVDWAVKATRLKALL